MVNIFIVLLFVVILIGTVEYTLRKEREFYAPKPFTIVLNKWHGLRSGDIIRGSSNGQQLLITDAGETLIKVVPL